MLRLHHTASFLGMLFCSLVMLGAATSSAFGAEKAGSTNYLLEVKRGISFAQFTNGLGQTPTHEFTVGRDSTIVRCVSHHLDKPFQKYYFVFVNDRLTKVCEPPPFDSTTVPYRNARREVRKPWKPEERVEQVMQSKDLVGEVLAESIRRRQRPPKTGPGQLPPGLVSVVAPRLERAQKAVEAVAQKFNPYKVTLGDGPERVEAQFGQPHHTETLPNGYERRCYGSPKHGVNITVWVMVGFSGGKAVEVFSDDFFDTDKTSKLAPQC